MSEWPRNQESNRIVISTASTDSIGVELSTLNAGGVSAVWPAANLAAYVPFVIHQPFIAVKMGLSNGTVVSGNVDVGIYDDQQNRIISKGSTAQAGVSAVQEFDITDTLLQPGCYFMAANCDNITGTVVRWAPGATGTGPSFGVYTQAVGAVTLPNPAVFASSTGTGTGFMPYIMVTGRTVV